MRAATFPSAEETANAFFAEAIRHLNDGYILYQADRYPGAIASAHKAQELAVKSALILENAMGFWSRIFETHTPLTLIENHANLGRLYSDLNQVRPSLAFEAKAFEAFEPKGFTRNAEYPFHPISTGPVTFRSPAQEFGAVEARAFLNLAREVVVATQAICAPTLVPGGEPVPNLVV